MKEIATLFLLGVMLVGCSTPMVGDKKESFGDLKTCKGKGDGDCIMIN